MPTWLGVLGTAHLADKYLERGQCFVLLLIVSFKPSSQFIIITLDAVDPATYDVPILVAIPPFDCLTAHCRVNAYAASLN